MTRVSASVYSLPRQMHGLVAFALLSSTTPSFAQALDPDAPHVFSAVELIDQPASTTRVVVVEAGGPIDPYEDTDMDDACDGFVTRGPSVVVDYRGDATALRFTARSEAKRRVRETTRPTLLVHRPDGRWVCDHGGLGRRFPDIQLTEPAPGRYSVWVGAYESPRGEVELTIELLPRDAGGTDATTAP